MRRLEPIFTISSALLSMSSYTFVRPMPRTLAASSGVSSNLGMLWVWMVGALIAPAGFRESVDESAQIVTSDPSEAVADGDRGQRPRRHQSVDGVAAASERGRDFTDRQQQPRGEGRFLLRGGHEALLVSDSGCRVGEKLWDGAQAGRDTGRAGPRATVS